MTFWTIYFILCTLFLICVVKITLKDNEDFTLQDLIIGMLFCYTPLLNLYSLFMFFRESRVLEKVVLIKGKKIDNDEQE